MSSAAPVSSPIGSDLSLHRTTHQVRSGLRLARPVRSGENLCRLGRAGPDRGARRRLALFDLEAGRSSRVDLRGSERARRRVARQAVHAARTAIAGGFRHRRSGRRKDPVHWRQPRGALPTPRRKPDLRQRDEQGGAVCHRLGLPTHTSPACDVAPARWRRLRGSAATIPRPRSFDARDFLQKDAAFKSAFEPTLVAAGATIIDPADTLCDSGGRREIADAEGPIYWDNSHLAVQFARAHALWIDRTLAPWPLGAQARRWTRSGGVARRSAPPIWNLAIIA